MLSVCIPVFNYDIRSLVLTLYDQLHLSDTEWEVLVQDDASTDETLQEVNRECCESLGVFYSVNSMNLGRSKTRNLLIERAGYDKILFLDADVTVTNSNFIQDYIDVLDSGFDIAYGGISYAAQPETKDKTLRWKFGKAREELSSAVRKKKPHLRLLTLNFLIDRSRIGSLRFREDIPNLRHEDTLFAFDAQQASLTVLHIDNPVRHDGVESNEVFLQKELTSSRMLAYFMHRGIIRPDFVSLSRMATKLKGLNLLKPTILVVKASTRAIESNLTSTRPILRLFDLYRLYEFVRFSEELKMNESRSIQSLFGESQQKR